MKIVDHDQRREEVAAAAANIIASQGIEALTTRRLASEMGCSLGVLSHYFKNKDEILHAALNWAEKRIAVRLENALQSGFSIDQFKPIILQVLPLDEESDLEWRVRLNLTIYAFTHPELGQVQREQLMWAYEFAADLIRRFQESGEIRADASAATLATLPPSSDK